MKRTLLVLMLAASLPSFAAMETYTIDPRHTFPSFEVGHFGYSIQRGRFNRTSGRIGLDTAARTGSVEVTIDTASVSTGLDKLEEHLRGEDFLDAAKFPAMTFKSRKFDFDGDRVKSVEGDLTLRGISRPVTLAATAFRCAPHPMTKKEVCGAEFTTTLKRSEFGMKYALPALADDVLLRINIEAIHD
jgi:polyisoprenoid-binding protein YceI